MDKLLTPPRRFAVVGHPKIPDSLLEAQEIVRFLEAQKVDLAVSGSIYDQALRRRIQNGEFELLIAIGGDGTMLRAGRLCAPAHLPLLGVNMGRFGFLTEVRRDQWSSLIPRLLEGKYWLEPHMMLVTQHWRGGQCLRRFSALNEVVVCRGQSVRPIRLHACVDGQLLANFVADGLIASTPTGSTAYALAAGGPILPPELRNILIVPVAPHLSIDRATILSEGSYVTITAYTDHEAVFSVDGQSPEIMQDGDSVRVEAAEDAVQFVRFQDRGYFFRNLTRYLEQNPSAGNAG